MKYHNKISDSDEYLRIAGKVAFLIDTEIQSAEADIKQDRFQKVALRLPALISSVNFFGYLRGQDNMFVNVRPMTELQKELYKIEDNMESRLNLLIKTVNNKAPQVYRHRLLEYFVTSRGITNLDNS